MRTVQVTNKEELEKAKNNDIDKIIITGQLAEDFKKAEKIKKWGPRTIGIVSVGLLATPITGGISAAFVAPIALAAGVSIPTIIIAASIGLNLIIALYKNYDVEYDLKNLKITLTKK